MKNFIALALAALTLSSCSLGEKFGRLKAEEGTTIVQFAKQRSLAAIAPGPALPGGVMVYAERADGFRAAFQLADETDTRQFRLPNGTYQFRAVGWSAQGLSGTTQCGFGGTGNVPMNFTLAGRDTDIPISMRIDRCGTADFADGDFVNGDVFTSPTLVFCGAGANLATKDAAGNCVGDGQESARVVHGRTSGGVGAKLLEFHPASGHVLYTADLHELGKKELFSVPFGGGPTTQQSGKVFTRPSSTGVEQARAVPNTRKIMFLAEESAAGQQKLFVSTVGAPGARPLFTTPALSNVNWFNFSEDGRWLFIVGEAAVAGRKDLYTAELLDGEVVAGPVAHIPTNTGGSGIRFENGLPFVRVSPVTLPNGATAVAFLGSYNGSNSELFITKAGTTAAHQVTSRGNPVTPTFPATTWNASNLAFLSDGNSVAWVNTIDTNGGELMLTRLASAPLASRISLFDSPSIFAASPNRNTVIYSKTVSSKKELIMVDVGPTNSFSDVTLYAPSGIKPNYHTVRFLANNRITVFGDVEASTAGLYELYAGSLVSTPPAVAPVSDANLGSGTPVSDAALRLQFASETRAFLMADNSTNPGVGYFYDIDLTSSTRVSAPIGVGGTLPLGQTAMNVFRGGLLYTAAEGAAPRAAAHYYHGGSSTQIVTGTKINSVFLPKSIGDGTGYPLDYQSAAFLIGSAPSSTVPDIFIKKDITLADSSDLTKLSHLFDDPSGYGYYRVRLLPYRRGPGGVPEINGAGIESACLSGNKPSSPDGTATGDTGLRIPYGSVASSALFLTAIDIYENAACSGDFQRRIFPQGLRGLVAVTPAAAAKIASQPGQVRIFLRD